MMSVVGQEVASFRRTRAGSLDRKGVMARLGAALVGAAMLGVLETKQAAACPAPGDCFGLEACSCHGGGCPGPGIGNCCWYYSDPWCQVWQCCDVTCADGYYGICRYAVCLRCAC